MGNWSTEEEVVVLYYASREIRYCTIIELLQHKCHTSVHKKASLTNRLRKLKNASQDAGLGQMQNTTINTGQARPWDRKVVDSWLVRMMEKGKLEKVLEFDGATAAIIEPDHDIDKFLDTMTLNV
ncbi:hypothetical protein HO173_005728 [Letharia columbiana]|uniref:Uncharacterized protein n=1 Tax=Letharia columbiana TaxID=112416 RepID=A0A8H6FWG3_9LECA|nr:uncharacterized protein HO173_005728 [Letharia columbiana]KAF6236100.1 hypothetical protein HO173_005728 [Letharia columbiana]